MKRIRRKHRMDGRSQTRRSGEAQPTQKLQAPPAQATKVLSKKHIRFAVAAIALIFLLGGLAFLLFADQGSWSLIARTQPSTVARFVGSDVCATCHQLEAQSWQGSQHKLAMDHATDRSVLGNFSDAGFDYFGTRSRFYRKDGKFYVQTDGPDGKLADFKVKYTFGVAPLQQYLVEFPDGRIQALPFAWDTRSKDQGGQRWFHLYPKENIRHDDVLHWTKLNQNWNFMCAECHSTGIHKNYNAASDSFATTWAEIDVGCEACHGAGSNHVTWARSRKTWRPFGRKDDGMKGLAVLFDERKTASWAPNSATGNPTRSIAPATLRKEVETCGLCHARRGTISEDWVPGHWLSDTHAVSMIEPQLYDASGQMLEEVYNYGSFKQSRMFAAGVTCSDCHDPHSAKLRLSVNETCLQCHSADKYAAVTHSHHDGISPPLACASCHMPVRTYMVIDQRHDHSFRIPRPDQSARFGTPNACNDCHKDRSPEWAATAIEGWYGPDRKSFQTYTAAFHAAWTDREEGAALLTEIVSNPEAPAIARASAFSELAIHVAPGNIDLAKTGLTDPDPMVRIAALDMLTATPDQQRWSIAAPLLNDPVRGVRIKAVSILASVPTSDQPAADRNRFDRAAAEFIAAQQLNADRPEARSALGMFYVQRSRYAEAEAEYRAALKLSPQYTPAAVDLADLYKSEGRDGDGEKILRDALIVSPQDAGLHHALGLALVRSNRLADAIDELRQAVRLDPDQVRYAYVYAIALNSTGRVEEALTALKENIARHPTDRDTLAALIAFSRAIGDFKGALVYAETLAGMEPNDRNLVQLITDLRRQVNSPR